MPSQVSAFHSRSNKMVQHEMEGFHPEDAPPHNVIASLYPLTRSVSGHVFSIGLGVWGWCFPGEGGRFGVWGELLGTGTISWSKGRRPYRYLAEHVCTLRLLECPTGSSSSCNLAYLAPHRMSGQLDRHNMNKKICCCVDHPWIVHNLRVLEYLLSSYSNL